MSEFLENYRFLIDNLGEGVYFVDNDRKISYWNDAAEKITGFSKEEVVGKYCYDNILKHIDNCGTELCTNGCPLEATCKDGQIRKTEVFLHHKKGHRVPVQVRAIPIMGEDFKVKGAIEVFTSTVDEAYNDKFKELEKIAMTDAMTGVANRLYTEKFIEKKINIHRVANMGFGLAFLDIDHFKKFNDTYGHDIGDEVIKTVAKTISTNLRSNDLVGRWGGEEFIIVFDGLAKENLEMVLNKIRILIAKSEIQYNGEILKITASIGGCIVKEGDTRDEIVKRADILMYKSKENGRNQVSI